MLCLRECEGELVNHCNVDVLSSPAGGLLRGRWVENSAGRDGLAVLCCVGVCVCFLGGGPSDLA